MAELDLLQQLHDLHLPDSPGFWPLAWGWWLLLAVLLITLSLSGCGLRRYRLWLHKKNFLQRLQQIEKQHQLQPEHTQLINLAYLLKEVALQYYPRDQVASLHGQAWLDFLQMTSKETLPASMQLVFTEMIYQPATQIDLNTSIQFARSWIKKQRQPCMS